MTPPGTRELDATLCCGCRSLCVCPCASSLARSPARDAARIQSATVDRRPQPRPQGPACRPVEGLEEPAVPELKSTDSQRFSGTAPSCKAVLPELARMDGLAAGARRGSIWGRSRTKTTHRSLEFSGRTLGPAPSRRCTGARADQDRAVVLSARSRPASRHASRVLRVVTNSTAQSRQQLPRQSQS